MNESNANPWPALAGKPAIAPSLLAVDFARAGEQIAQVIRAGAEVLHVDVMDGHFVPNLSMGPPVIGKLRRFTDHPMDVHLMVTDAERFVEPFVKAGAGSINFHIEASGHFGTGRVAAARKLIEQIRGHGVGAAITLKPETPAEAIREVVADVDMVLVMTVEPGYGGQEFMANQLPKIETIRSWLRPEQRLEVDGGINPPTAARCAAAGADTFVAGENIFGSNDPAAAVAALKQAVGGL